ISSVTRPTARSSASSCVAASTISVTASMSMSTEFSIFGGKPAMNPFDTTASLYFMSPPELEHRHADGCDDVRQYQDEGPPVQASCGVLGHLSSFASFMWRSHSLQPLGR